MNCYFVVPSLKISGGVREALRLAENMARRGSNSTIVCMWDSPYAMKATLPLRHLSKRAPRVGRALFDLPGLFLQFRRLVREVLLVSGVHRVRFVFTHYATLPLALILPREDRLFFVQDLEWKFVGNTVLSSLLRRIIVFFYRRGTVISSNSYLTAALHRLNVPVCAESPIWADPAFATDCTTGERDVDFVMVLRKGAHKRLDLYLSFIDQARRQGDVSIVVISPENDIIEAVRDRVATAMTRPSTEEMRQVYRRSKCFVHLSDHEGFGLPPLEAMGAGCVPICRDSGGVRAFIADSELAWLLISPETGIDEIFRRSCKLIRQPTRLEALSRAAKDVFVRGLETRLEADHALRGILF